MFSAALRGAGALSFSERDERLLVQGTQTRAPPIADIPLPILSTGGVSA